MRTMFLSIVFGLLGIAQTAAGQTPAGEELEVEHAITTEIVTPHTAWARPYARGSARVLFFGMGTEFDGSLPPPRTCVEILQRFDISAEAAFWVNLTDSTGYQWNGGRLGEQRILRLLDKQWDCFVFLGIPVTNLSAEQQYKMFKQVVGGAGLVLVGADDGRVFRDKLRLKELPPLLASEFAGEAFRIAKGRGVRMPLPPRLDYHEGWGTEYDYQAERMGRAIVWAAGKEPHAQIEIVPVKQEFTSAEPKTITIKLSGAPIKSPCRLQLAIRRSGDEPILLPEREIKHSDKFDIALPSSLVAAGAYHVDAKVISSAGVETWTTLPLTIVSPRTVADISLIEDWSEIGGHIQGSVILKGSTNANETLRVRLLDRHRRELVRQDFPARDKTTFSLDVAAWLPNLVTVEAQLLDGGVERSSAYQYFTITHRNRNQFNFLMWGAPAGTLAPYAEDVMARTGVTLILGGGFMDTWLWASHSPPERVPEIPRHYAAYGMAVVPYTFHINGVKTPDGVKSPYCWNDTATRDKHAALMAKYNMANRKIGVFAYSLGDECVIRNSCLSPHCAQAYRDYLKQSYGDLPALNASWKTNFTDWQQVGISSPNDNDESTSLNAGNYPRWYDRQAFKSHNCVQYCKTLGKAYAAIDPQAKTGFEGCGTFGQGDDIDLIVRTLGFWLPYPFSGNEVIGAMPARSNVVGFGNWIGYERDAESLLRHYWSAVTRGADTVGWWMLQGVGKYHGWLAPDLRPYPAVKDILQDTRFIREGVGDVLIRSPIQHDGIAMLYSFPSTFAHKLQGGDGFGGYESGHLKVLKAIRDLGLQCRYVSDRMLRLGEFDASQYRVLVLSRADAIGPKEARVIRQFVEQGGTVIADVRPGMYDDHCKPLKQGILDDLFGIRHEGSSKAKTVNLMLPNKDGKSIRFGPVLTDASVKLAHCSAVPAATIDGVPVLIKKPCGKGVAVLLNFSSFSLPDLASNDILLDVADMLESLFSAAGVKSTLTLADKMGAKARDIEVTRWKNGDMEILSLFQQYGQQRDVSVTLPSPRAIYELRSGKLLGTATTFSATVRPARPAFFAIWPKPSVAPIVKTERLSYRQGELAQCTISVPQAIGLHPIKIHVTTSGKELDYFVPKVCVDGRGATIDLPIAFNDPKGTWNIRAEDIITGQVSMATFQVE